MQRRQYIKREKAVAPFMATNAWRRQQVSQNPDLHRSVIFWKPDPDPEPYQSEKLDPDPHQTGNWAAVKAQNKRIYCMEDREPSHWGFKMEPGRIWVARLHHFDEEQDLDPDQRSIKQSDPDPHQSESGIRIRTVVFWISSATPLYFTNYILCT